MTDPDDLGDRAEDYPDIIDIRDVKDQSEANITKWMETRRRIDGTQYKIPLSARQKALIKEMAAANEVYTEVTQRESDRINKEFIDGIKKKADTVKVVITKNNKNKQELDNAIITKVAETKKGIEEKLPSMTSVTNLKKLKTDFEDIDNKIDERIKEVEGELLKEKGKTVAEQVENRIRQATTEAELNKIKNQLNKQRDRLFPTPPFRPSEQKILAGKLLEKLGQRRKEIT